MTTTFRLPDLGEGVHEAEILAVAVAVGDTVAEGQPILEVETDKAAVEIPSPTSGTVSEVRVAVGDIVKVGDILISFDSAEKSRAATPAPEKTTNAVPHLEHHGDRQGPVPASPSTRRLARELGINLRLVTASGSGGVVTREDVEAYAKGLEAAPAAEHEERPTPPTPRPSPAPSMHALHQPPPPSALPDFSKWGPIEKRPFRSIRRATAAQMATSWSIIPHVHCEDSVDITRLEQFRQKHKKEIAAAGGRLTMTIFAMKAAATALKTYPHFNASLDVERREIIVKNYFHLGIATDSDSGLFVPVIRDVDRKSIKELAVEVAQAVDRVRGGKISRDELQGGTFTITNAGALGGHRFSAIVNHPEVAILGLGQGRLQPVVVNGSNGAAEIVPRLMMPLVLCFDHRVVDGADAIRFLRLIIAALEDPDELFITMI
jgi:pyruvate dehydrogenase E2 component (dihydrolipoamide acetyltransferase)